MILSLIARTGLVIWLLLNGFVTETQIDSVHLKLSVISASDNIGPADPALKRISKRLKRAFGRQKGFKRISAHTFELLLGKTKHIKLANRQTANITYLGSQKKKHRFKILASNSKIEMTVVVRRKKLAFIPLRWRRRRRGGGGDIIILVLMPR